MTNTAVLDTKRYVYDDLDELAQADGWEPGHVLQWVRDLMQRAKPKEPQVGWCIRHPVKGWTYFDARPGYPFWNFKEHRTVWPDRADAVARLKLIRAGGETGRLVRVVRRK